MAAITAVPLMYCRIAEKLEALFTLETLFCFCWAGQQKQNQYNGSKGQHHTTQPSSIGTVKHSAPEAATQPSGCVRSMKACPCSVSAQWKSRVPLLLTPHYPTQYSNPVRQLKWVVPPCESQFLKNHLLQNVFHSAFIPFLLSLSFL